MTRAISRDSFDEIKNYLGVYLQQGRVLLDADWNENQDIGVSFVRRLVEEAIGDGSPNNGFLVSPIFPPLLLPQTTLPAGSSSGLAGLGAVLGMCLVDLLTVALEVIFGSLPFFLQFPGFELDGFESLTDPTTGNMLWSLSSPQGSIRLGQDRPYDGASFLRMSGYAAPVTISKTIPMQDLSQYDLATFRYRVSSINTVGDFNFWMQDDAGNKSVWRNTNAGFAEDFWLAGFASPLNLDFHVITAELPPAYVGQTYSTSVTTFGGQAPITWALSGSPPPWLVSPPTSPASNANGADPNTATLTSGGQKPTTVGSFTFTVTATDANHKTTAMTYTLEVTPPPPANSIPPIPPALLAGLFPQLMASRTSTPTGTAANLERIVAYGFDILYQDSANPIVWDFDALGLGSAALEEQQAKNNFIIRGSQFDQFLSQLTLISLLSVIENSGGGGGSGSNSTAGLLDLFNSPFELANPSVENAGRLYVAGLPCVQVHDELYSSQADPNDPPLAPPAAAQPARQDAIYLDAWQEPVTYVEDPSIRDIALGGPDTATRLAVRSRVRVAQGGSVPTSDGRGLGTLATEGSYTGTANRYYLVEIDRAGNIGASGAAATATMRWSEDNASTIQRIIADVPAGATQVTVEDASGFNPGDVILIRKEFGAENHTISSIFSNVITLGEPTGAGLAQLPAGVAGVPHFTDFLMSDQPKIQRWNAVGVPIVPDSADATVSASLPLNDGVAVRFGGKQMLAGDYWNFNVRYLAGDEATGIDPDTRIETVSFQGPKGVIHHYTPLALVTRDPAQPEPDQITQVLDRRYRTGTSTTTTGTLSDVQSLTGTAQSFLGGLQLSPSSTDSKFVVFWSGDLTVLAATAPSALPSTLTIQVSFYNDQMTDPQTSPATGKVQDRTLVVNLSTKPAKTDVPLTLWANSSSVNFSFLPPPSFAATSVQVFAQLSDTVSTVALSNMQLLIIELKKSF